jgi:MATE family multidrug resistance protein
MSPTADPPTAVPRPADSWRTEFAATLRLALPVVAVQVGMMLMGVVDTMMVGRVSAEALAAVALGALYFHGVAAFGMGLLLALDPVVAQAVGARDAPAVARAVQRGFVLAAVVSVPLMLAMLPAEGVLRALGQPTAVLPYAAGYVRASMPGVVPLLAFVVVRQVLQAMGHTRAIVVTIVVANVANVVLNWALIFGHLGAPALGPVGSAWASTGCRCLMALLLVVGAWTQLRPTLRPWRAEAVRAPALVALTRLGLPIAAQQLLEFGAFGTVGLLMGRLGTAAMAGHQTALNLAALTFMVPLGIGAAAAVRVGHAVGAGDAPGMRRAAGAALACGVGFMATSACVLLLAPRALARLYTPDERVLAVAAALIPLAGIFQVFDGLQVVSLGVLRGAGDVRAPTVINVVGFWVIGLPVGIWLGLYTSAGPRGLWWGLVAGLAAVSGILALRVRQVVARGARRLADG